MTEYAYKCVAAPRKARKTREHRTPAAALVAAMEEAIATEAASGWEYLRTDLVPMEAKSGWFSTVVETHQGVMVFRRAVGGPARAASGEAPHEEAHRRAEPRIGRPRPEAADDPDIPSLGAARIE
jgi:hypothetical protein